MAGTSFPVQGEFVTPAPSSVGVMASAPLRISLWDHPDPLIVPPLHFHRSAKWSTPAGVLSNHHSSVLTGTGFRPGLVWKVIPPMLSVLPLLGLVLPVPTRTSGCSPLSAVGTSHHPTCHLRGVGKLRPLPPKPVGPWPRRAGDPRHRVCQSQVSLVNKAETKWAIHPRWCPFSSLYWQERLCNSQSHTVQICLNSWRRELAGVGSWGPATWPILVSGPGLQEVAPNLSHLAVSLRPAFQGDLF